MRVVVEKDAETLSCEAAQCVADGILHALSEHGEPRVILGADAGLTKVSEKLAEVSGIDWARVVLFYFNEYVRIPASHYASSRCSLRRLFAEKLTVPLREFNEINGGGTRSRPRMQASKATD
jgi:6-phosphogluconolactonase/glucosamine-6-phosphate isomerase/deaminase